MSIHPAPPQSLHDLVDAFAQSTQSVIDLGRACSDDDLAQPTACPGWTVKDQISHIAGVEAWLGGHKDPRVALPQYEHIRSDFGKRVEYAVEVRRGHTSQQVLAELERVLAQRLSTLRDPGLGEADIIAGPFGPAQAAAVMRLRAFDIWAHEQDIRSALAQPGNLGSPAAAVFVSMVIRQLPRLVARGASLEPGHAVVIEVTGSPTEVTARQGIRVELDDQGRPRGHEVPADQLTGDLVTTISLSTDAFTRRAAGRRPVSDTAYSVDGDEAVGRRVLEALVVTD